MASWRKLLAEMAAHPKPVNYTYAEAAKVLRNLGFTLSDSEGSHRVWKKRIDARTTIRVGLVEAGHGTLKSVYIKEMIRTLRAYGLLEESRE